ncbi:type II toxin-antitoxin system HicB family antitoxin [Candidatus Gottesmanbacteria bacterium]|nr:type II toxin-antitoxin system HicB family antitoxin [Candidatus Gottesmanbacteria bacterium]
MNIHHFTVAFQKEPDGGYTAIVPALPGCVTWGETVEAAQVAVREAIQSYLGSLAKDHEETPHDVSFVSSVDVVSSLIPHAYA